MHGCSLVYVRLSGTSAEAQSFVYVCRAVVQVAAVSSWRCVHSQAACSMQTLFESAMEVDLGRARLALTQWWLCDAAGSALGSPLRAPAARREQGDLPYRGVRGQDHVRLQDVEHDGVWLSVQLLIFEQLICKSEQTTRHCKLYNQLCNAQASNHKADEELNVMTALANINCAGTCPGASAESALPGLVQAPPTMPGALDATSRWPSLCSCGSTRARAWLS